ncbi:MAG: AarF/ABC1/UbiB kinase family protein [Bacteroidetes bacterium]|nr:AarF/ABC1/UbiB kinase family protein [Bacteroidota bacterium]
MKEQEKIPTSKVQRASKFVSTGAKVGINYLKYYATGAKDKERLDTANAEDIYSSLSNLKGSALKVAQVLSMDQGILPEAYTKKFAMAQYSAPPLSLPLVVKTFKQELGKSPFEVFKNFSKNAVNAASMGQVHSGELNGKKMAIKVQYPGVANSVISDLNLIKPFATRIIGMKGADVEQYIEEVKDRLLEETDYDLELKRSVDLSYKLGFLEGIKFPKYYPEYSSKRIITMEWLAGQHLDEFLATKPSQEIRNALGQKMWDFYNYQLHHLKTLHADPHPGNFLFSNDGTLGVIDFGCIKELDDSFYHRFFDLLLPSTFESEALLEERLLALNMIFEDDSEYEKAFFKDVLKESITMLSKPIVANEFDFGDKAYMKQIFEYGEQMSKVPELRKSKKARGPKDALFVNRTFFGLYNLLHDLGAVVNTNWDYEMAK